jgi:hypothetical protein
MRNASVQRPLVEVAATPKLTPRQALAFQLVKVAPNGTTAEWLGAELHARKGKHPVAEPCQWCESEGLSVLRSKALRPLVIRRRTGLWEPRDRADRTADRGSQLSELPDWLQ